MHFSSFFVYLHTIVCIIDMYGLTKTPREIMRSYANNIRIIRKEKGFSQRKLAEKSGVAYGTLQKFESTGIISLESFLKLCKAIDRLEEFESLLTPKNNDRDSLFDF